MKMMTNFDRLWSEMETEAEALSGRGILKRRISSDGRCPMFLGIRQPENRRAFIIHVAKDVAPLPEVLPISKGFDFEVLIAGDEDRDEDVSIILSAARADYHEVFAAICDDIFTKLWNLTGSRDAVNSLLKRMRLWQIFFEKQAGEGLSREAQIGLYGELHFLRRFVLSLRIDEAVLRSWMGSIKRQHDFQFGSLSVEVKTSSAKQHQTLHIASEQQLDESLVARLVLFHLSVSLVENSKDTLPAIIDDIRQTLAGSEASVEQFDNMLLERGFSDAHCHLYEHTGYSIRRSGFYLVHDEFPRIKEDELRGGVGDVKYSISLNGCSDYAVSEDDFVNELRRALQ
ncbi:MAG: PD-(D/E)XK motif protein [Aquisalimonadaceae bacterium]